MPCETFAQPRRNFVGMEAGLAELELAVRVLSAINDNQTPEPEDLNELRRIAPSLAYLPPDDLAFDVIEHAIQQRDMLRKMASDR